MWRSWRGPRLVVWAPAKVNLFLRVKGRRPDGYHELESLVVAVNLFDTLVFRPLRSESEFSVVIHSNVEELASGHDNLVRRAVELVGQRLAGPSGRRFGLRVWLHKRIPLRSGLGGGSSDAGATLRALRDWLSAPVAQRTLMDWAAELGSDVPFFASGSSAAIVRGRGELVEPVKLGRPLHLVLVQPGPGVGTREVFERLWAGGRRSQRSCEVDELLGALREGWSGQAIQEVLVNDLLEPAICLRPEIGEALKRLQGAGMPASLTGSGSVLFVLAQSQEEAVGWARWIRQQLSLWVTVVRSLEGNGWERS
jgi:4-diphosphocytidyl-2-C-methyl-D-erythritol kinase